MISLLFGRVAAGIPQTERPPPPKTPTFIPAPEVDSDSSVQAGRWSVSAPGVVRRQDLICTERLVHVSTFGLTGILIEFNGHWRVQLWTSQNILKAQGPSRKKHEQSRQQFRGAPPTILIDHLTNRDLLVMGF